MHVNDNNAEEGTVVSHYTINSKDLAVVDEYNYLGVTSISNVSWTFHIGQVIAKASRKMWSLGETIESFSGSFRYAR